MHGILTSACPTMQNILETESRIHLEAHELAKPHKRLHIREYLNSIHANLTAIHISND